MGDFSYRTREEVDQWKTRCPILRLKNYLLDQAVSSESELHDIDAAVSAEVEEAHRTAEASPWPEPSTAATHVYAETSRMVPTPVRLPDGQREITYMQATLEALSYEMANNPRIFVLGEGIGKRGGNFKTTAGLYERLRPRSASATPPSASAASSAWEAAPP